MAATPEQAAHYRAMATAAEDISMTRIHPVDTWPGIVHPGDGRCGTRWDTRGEAEAQ
jgi:hypothetical protein